MKKDYSKMDTLELMSYRYQLVKECAHLEEELNIRRRQDRHVMRKSELNFSAVHASGIQIKGPTHLTARAVAPELGFNIHNLQAFFDKVPPGSSEGAYHMHGEAIKYYVSGKGIETIGNKTYEVNSGDTVFIPANTWHGTHNPGPDPLLFLAITTSMLAVPLCIQPLYKAKSDEEDTDKGTR